MKFLTCAVLLIVAGDLPAAESSPLRPWTNYHTIMWISDTAYRHPEKVPQFFERLREMGINTAMVHGDGKIQPLLLNHYPYYVENMVNRGLCLKFHSKVADWDQFVTDWNKTGRGETAFARDYSLDDPQWLGWARGEMQNLVRKNRGNAPLAYNVRDELSTTISANPFDYDFSPAALAGFRNWLQEQYPGLAELNTEWQTQFRSWAEVKPFTTDQIKNRMATGEAIPRGNPDWPALRRVRFEANDSIRNPTRWNFSPWCDFRTYMDFSLARTLARLRDAAHELDPETPVGIEGTQMPSAWGGYDLWRLSQVLDWVEPYDIGNAREIFGSFMPGKPLVTTVFEKDTNHARRRLWHLLLEGDRACLVWWSEDCIKWAGDSYVLSAKAEALAPVLKEMTSPLAGLFLRARREVDPIYIVYSQPSIQVDWLLESTTDTASWYRRFSSFEAEHNVMARKRNGWLKLFQDLGYSPQFIAAERLERGLDSGKSMALVLSDARALSDGEVDAVEQLFNRTPAVPRSVFFDAPAGAFDHHGRLRRRAPALSVTAGISAKIARDRSVDTVTNSLDIASFDRDRQQRNAQASYAWVEKQTFVSRPVRFAPDLCARVHRFHVGEAQLLAFERNVDYHMSEDLRQAGGNDSLEKPVTLTASLAEPGEIYDLRSGAYLGRTNRIAFTLDPWQPSLFAVLPKPFRGASLLRDLLAR